MSIEQASSVSNDGRGLKPVGGLTSSRKREGIVRQQ